MPYAIHSGQTSPGQGWQTYTGGGGPGIFIDVDTRFPNGVPRFSVTPRYVISLGGNSAHWATTGGNAVYLATNSGFRVYIRRADGGPIDVAGAQIRQWHINWIGIEGEPPG